MDEGERMLPMSTFDSVGRVTRYQNGSIYCYGSASCIGHTSKYDVWLTNNHVTGDVGNDVRIEYFVNGKRSERIKGEVIWSQNTGKPLDAAVVIIPRQTGAMAPKALKLALDWEPSIGDLIVDYGCSNARAPRMRLGSIEKVGTHTFTYSPPAHPGDSGSPVISVDGQWQLGLTTWNNGSKPTWGRAQTISSVAAEIKSSWNHSDPEVAAIFDAKARKDGLFRRPPSQSDEFRGFFRRLIDNMEYNRETRDTQFATLQDHLAKSADMQVGLLDRLRKNRLEYEKKMLELERQRAELQDELRKQDERRRAEADRIEKENRSLNDSMRDLRRKYFTLMGFLEMAFYVLVLGVAIWLGTALFGAGWLLKLAGFIGKAFSFVAYELWHGLIVALTPGKKWAKPSKREKKTEE